MVMGAGSKIHVHSNCVRGTKLNLSTDKFKNGKEGGSY